MERRLIPGLMWMCTGYTVDPESQAAPKMTLEPARRGRRWPAASDNLDKDVTALLQETGARESTRM